MATGPYYILDLNLGDEALLQLIHEAMSYSRKDMPHRALTLNEQQAYHQKLGVKSHRELGTGVDISLEEDEFTVTPFDTKGLFGDPIKTDAANLLETVKECLKLLPEKVS